MSPSLRSSERGLKLDMLEHCKNCISSLRSSERGLKCSFIDKYNFITYVAPFVGAWIEIADTNGV